MHPRLLLRVGLPVAAAVAAAGTFALPSAGASAPAHRAAVPAVHATPATAGQVAEARADVALLRQAARPSPTSVHRVAGHRAGNVHLPTGTTETAAATSAAADSGYGCTDALAYLRAHSAPGFAFECPGYADGRQAMTCINVTGLCGGEHLIAIAVPCRAAYLNEASNSWVLTGHSSRPIDPYGYCHS